MRRAKIPKIKIIQSKSGKVFEDSFNQSMVELFEQGHEDPDYRIDHGSGEFTAIVIYQETKELIDTVADEFHAEGIYYKCNDCPYMEDPQDKRIKWCNCKMASLGRTHRTNEACEFFYRQLKAGRIEPVEERT